MIEEIGIVVGLYVLTRMIPVERTRLTIIFSVLTALVCVLVITDLTVRSITSKSILSFVLSDPSQDQAHVEAPAKTDQAQQVTSVTKVDGGSITTELGYGIAVAKGSSLRREWITVHMPSFPLDIEGTAGVTTRYESKQYGGDYKYRATLTINVSQEVSSFEIRFLTFDVWGDHVRSLNFEQVVDVKLGKHEFQAEWPLYSENEVEAHYASIAYVARVRLKDGRILLAPEKPILEEARKFSGKFTPAQLEPKNSAPPNASAPVSN